jgi:hypothetical protein
VVGEESVIGSATHVLELQIKSGASILVAHRQKLWVDKQTFVTLKTQAWDKYDNLRWETVYESFTVNPPVGLEPFDTTPPLASIVIDMRPATPEDLAQRWAYIRSKFPSPLFKLNLTGTTEIREGRRQYFLESRGIVSQALVEPAPEPGHAGGDKLWMVVIQGPPSTLSVTGMGEGKPVSDSSIRGRLYSYARAYALEIDRDGTRIVLYTPASAGVNTSSLLVQYAKKLQIMEE